MTTLEHAYAELDSLAAAMNAEEEETYALVKRLGDRSTWPKGQI